MLKSCSQFINPPKIKHKFFVKKFLTLLKPPIVETLDNQVNWSGENEWQANKLDAMEPVQKFLVLVEAL